MPPGWNKHNTHEFDAQTRDCHAVAQLAERPPGDVHLVHAWCGISIRHLDPACGILPVKFAELQDYPVSTALGTHFHCEHVAGRYTDQRAGFRSRDAFQTRDQRTVTFRPEAVRCRS